LKNLKLVGSLILFLVAFDGAFIFSGQVFAESSNHKDTPFEFIKGQIVVSVEPDLDNASIKSVDDTILTSSELEQNGFHVLDSLLNSIEPEDGQTLSNDFKVNVVDKMGLVYLIDYAESDYKNIDEAKKELEKP